MKKRRNPEYKGLKAKRESLQQLPEFRSDSVSRRMADVFAGIRHALLNLPKPIRRVCFVQLFAFMGWYAKFSHY